ncbi:DUF3247 family protein [Coralloluteibacterium thermophilus]|uniref:DUF3247 family protein n=1 Tax=Coralloluteibacterium thermophilum TaxID=2707049 RepID=A0ABV9NLJ9_9GAMM
MGAFANNVYTDEATIDAIEARIRELPQSARVKVTLSNGQVYVGTVAERPNIQVFRNADGDEGNNAIVKLEDPLDAHQDAYLWIDEIVKVERVLQGPLDPDDLKPLRPE